MDKKNLYSVSLVFEKRCSDKVYHTLKSDIFEAINECEALGMGISEMEINDASLYLHRVVKVCQSDTDIYEHILSAIDDEINLEELKEYLESKIQTRQE